VSGAAFGESGQRGEAREGSDVEKDLVALQRACSSTVERDLDGPLGYEAAPSHHEFAIAGGEPVSDAFGPGLRPFSACAPESAASTPDLRRGFRAPRSRRQYERCLQRGRSSCSASRRYWGRNRPHSAVPRPRRAGRNRRGATLSTFLPRRCRAPRHRRYHWPPCWEISVGAVYASMSETRTPVTLVAFVMGAGERNRSKPLVIRLDWLLGGGPYIAIRQLFHGRPPGSRVNALMASLLRKLPV